MSRDPKNDDRDGRALLGRLRASVGSAVTSGPNANAINPTNEDTKPMTSAIANPSSIAKIESLYGKRANLKTVKQPARSGHDVSLRARNKRVDPQVLRDVLDEIDPTLVAAVPPPKGAHAALRAAARRCQRKVSRLPSGQYEWREVKDGTVRHTTRLAFVLAKKDAVVGNDAASTRLKMTDEARVMVDEVTGAFDLSVSVPALAGPVADLQRVYGEERGVLDCSGLWAVCQAVALKTGGGAVTINDGRILVQDVVGLEKLQAAFDATWARLGRPEWDAPVIIHQRVLFDDDNSSIARAVESEIAEQMVAVEKRLEEKLKGADDRDRAISKATVDSVIAENNELRNQALLFGGLLSKRAQRLLDAANRLEQKTDDVAKDSWARGDAREDAARQARRKK